MSGTKPRAWLMLAAACMAVLFNASLYATAGVLHISLLEHYPDEDAAVISWIGSLFSSMAWFASIFGSIVINITSARTCIILSAVLNLVGFALSSLVTDFRWLFLTLGLIAGSSQAMCYTASFVVIGYHFDKEKIGFAAGLANSASGLSLFIFPPLTEHFVDVYGLRGAFLLLGGIGLQAAVFGSIMTSTNYDRHSKLEKEISSKDDAIVAPRKIPKSTTWNEVKHLLMLSDFWKIILSGIFYGACASTIFLFIPEYFRQTGSLKTEAAFVMSIAGIVGIISRVLLGSLASIVDPVVLLVGTLGVTSIATIFVNTMSSFASRLCYGAALGIYTAGNWTLIYILIMEIAGIPMLSTAFGVAGLACGVGFATGPPLAEYLASLLHDQYYVFVFAAVFSLLSIVFNVSIRMKTKPVQEETMDD